MRRCSSSRNGVNAVPYKILWSAFVGTGVLARSVEVAIVPKTVTSGCEHVAFGVYCRGAIVNAPSAIHRDPLQP